MGITMKTMAAGTFLTMLIVLSCAERKTVRLKSPDKSYEFTCYLPDEANGFYYDLKFKGSQVIGPSRLGFIYDDDVGEADGIRIKAVTRNQVVSSWRPVYGEKDSYPEVYAEAVIDLQEGMLD